MCTLVFGFIKIGLRLGFIFLPIFLFEPGTCECQLGAFWGRRLCSGCGVSSGFRFHRDRMENEHFEFFSWHFNPDPPKHRCKTFSSVKMTFHLRYFLQVSVTSSKSDKNKCLSICPFLGLSLGFLRGFTSHAWVGGLCSVEHHEL